MHIILKDNISFSHRTYRMVRTEQDVVKKIVAELMEAEIVRESESDYASPVLLVHKKNGEPRLCIDYRRLNTQTVKDNYPLPQIDDQLDRLANGIYFCSLDLRAGYYRLPIAENSKRYTAFVTPTHWTIQVQSNPF